MSERVVPFPGTPLTPGPVPLTANPVFHRIVLYLGSVLVIFTRLWEATLSSYDDTYYAEKAKEILLTGDWLAPHWSLEPQFDNPPLYFWITAVLFRLFGISELTARLLSAAAGVGCIALTYRFGSRLFGPWVGFLSGAVLLSTPHFIKQSRHCMLDTTQTLLVGGAIYLLYLGLEKDRTWGPDLAAGVLMGLAVLNKSLLGYLPVVVYGIYCLAARPPWRRALRPSLLATATVALVLPGAWFGAMLARYGAEFVDGHFGYILLERALQGDPGQTVTLLSYTGYLTGLFSNFLPWIPATLWGIWTLWHGEESRRRALLPVCWALGVVGFLSLSAAQKSWYILPAYPALAILAGYGLDRFLARWPSGHRRFTVGFTGLLLAFHLVAATTPIPLDRDRNRDIATIAPAVRAAVPEGGHVIAFNLEPHWKFVSPLYFYADRPLSLPVKDPAVMERVIRNAEAAAILTNVETYSALLKRLDQAPRILASSGDLVLLAPP